MALSPLDRPPGSAQVLRYRGFVRSTIPGDIPTPVNLADFPKPDAIFPHDTFIVPAFGGRPAYFVAYARFALFDPGLTSPPLDPVALANTLRRLPGHVYDDNQPAGAAPHSVIVASSVGGVNDGESILNTTWVQNLEVRSSRLDDNVLQADIGINTQTADFVQAGDGSLGVVVLVDGPPSGAGFGGLGLNTGLPVVVVPFKVLATTGQSPAVQDFFVDVTFEVRHTTHR